jgi:hypothetical protein
MLTQYQLSTLVHLFTEFNQNIQLLNNIFFPLVGNQIISVQISPKSKHLFHYLIR